MRLGDQDPGPSSRWSLLTPFAAAAVAAVLGLYTLALPFGRDQGIHATIAAALQQGLLPYRDVFNIKPPMTTAVHWLALELFGHDVAAIRSMDLLLLMLSCAALAAATRRLLGSAFAGIAGGIGFAAMYYAQSYWTTAQTDGWATVCLSFVFYVLAIAWTCERGTMRATLMMVTGALFGIAFAFKYTVAVAGLVIFAPLLTRTGDARFDWRDLIFVALGGIACLAVLTVAMAIAGILADYLEIQGYVASYVGYTQPLAYQLLVAFAIPLKSQGAGLAALSGLAVVLVHGVRGRLTLYMAASLLALLAGFISGMVQGKAAGYYFLPMLTGCTMLVGVAAERLETALRRVPDTPRRIGCLALVVAMLATPALHRNLRLAADIADGKSRRQLWAQVAEPADYSFRDTLVFSDLLSRHRQDGEPIFVWGYETALYFLQDAVPIYRYPFIWPFAADYHDGRYTADLMARLAASPPTFFIVQKQDATPSVTGRQMDSRDLLQLYPGVDGFLTGGYMKIETTPRFELWRRNSR
jgi:4-amino-4-deoxy-L-arabinose transferase-like glycosyltransferase